jgi:integrase
MDLKTIQTLMRHTDHRTAANIYLHNNERLNREAIASLDIALNGNRSARKARKRACTVSVQ